MGAIAAWLAVLPARAAPEAPEATVTPQQVSRPQILWPCCVSLVRRLRTARTVGEDRLFLSLKTEYADFDEKRTGDGYGDLPAGDHNRTFSAVLAAKYGWAESHHVTLGIPFIVNDSDVGGKTLESNGLGNVYVFEKWNFLRESTWLPAMSADAWFFFPTGRSDEKLGSDHSSAKATVVLSKSWELLSLHFNPGYKWNWGPDTAEVNAAALITPHDTVWPLLEYNFISNEGQGDVHDLVPGVVLKPFRGSSLKLGAVINVHATTRYRGEVGFVAKLALIF